MDVLVVADDLTGANACAAGFSRAGWRAVTVGPGNRWGAIAEFHSRFDVVVATTESRHAPGAEARRSVTQAVRAGWPVRLVTARIDTTLRGNVGVAAEAVLATARELSGRRVVGLCLPAHPAAGRQTVEGRQLLDGVRLEETELARDVRSPVRTSAVADVLRVGTDLVTKPISLSTVTGSRADLVARIGEAIDGGADVVVADALTEEHLARVAEAAADVAADRDILWAGIDPGPGSVALAAALGLRGAGASATPVLAVSGSATGLTQTQLARLVSERGAHVVRPVGGPVPDVDATAARLREALADAAGGEVVLLATVIEPGDVGRLTPEQSARLPVALGRVTRRVLTETPVDGLYTTGGDVTAAVLAELGGQGIEVTGEVVPLAVAGEVVDGPWDGLPIVTKGGLIGGPDTAVACVDHLVRTAAQRRRWVRTAVGNAPDAP
ncbi:four-carbon acid sugar kinase family protein [Georgenia alba]|uniref:Four-carbon acid sugar kinase family protein n=1 Tax=Georgenia alba TaxID=2233858 RepID=A0ABW2Q3G5_9MICO